MKSATLSSKTSSLLMFLAVSVLAGLLLSGLSVPFVALASTGVNSAADAIEHLPAELETPPPSERSRVLMANGEQLAEFYVENRTNVSLEDVSPYMKAAQIAIEDHRFYEHGAIDLEGLGRALVMNLMGGSQQGASTLTQQYVKLVRVEAAMAKGDEEAAREATEVSIERKIIEMRYALALEKRLNKDEILEGYLNIAYYGDGAYGVEAAAQHYFGTSAKELTLDQAALLAGLVQNPVSLNPRLHTEDALERRDHVLNRMVETGAVSKEEAEAAKQATFDPKQIKPTRNGCVSSKYPFLCDYVRLTLLSDKMPSLGATTEERENQLNRGGLTIQTLIDPTAQDAAQSAVSGRIDARDPVLGASVLLQPSTGLIVAMAQSRPVMGDDVAAGETYWNINVGSDMGGAEGYQAGSTFKTFALAAGLEQGMTPSQQYLAPSSVDLRGWRFQSCEGRFRFATSHTVGGGRGDGPIDMRTATTWSVNTYFMQLVRDVGICQTTQMAKKAGVKLANGKDVVAEYNAIPSFVLGTAEVTPLSMAEAYATFANRGTHCDPIILQSVISRDGVELAVPSANCTQVMDPGVADGVTYLLQGVMNGTGAAARLSDGRAQAGKTGTIQDNQAMWFAGYTPEMAGVAMIAVDKTNSYYDTHRKSLANVRLPVSGTYLQGTGGGDAGRIWKAAMTAAVKKLPKTSFKDPSDKIMNGVTVPVPDVSGMSYDEAKATLEAANFSTQRLLVYSDYPEGTFLGAAPSKEAVKFSLIRLKVSKGPRPDPTPATASPSASPPASSAPPEEDQ